VPIVAGILSWIEQADRDVLHALTCTFHAPWLYEPLNVIQSWQLATVLLLAGVALMARTSPRLVLPVLLTAAAGFGLSMALASVLWKVIDRPRPAQAYEVVLTTPEELAACAERPDALALREGSPTSRAFPSRHGLTIGVFVAALFLASRRLGLAALVYGLAVAFGRLYLGKHWPSDVLGGALLGAAIAWACWRLAPPVLRILGLGWTLPRAGAAGAR
jgi:undecaprenyl-diphosphatase